MDWKICDFMTHDRVLAARRRFIQPIKNKKEGEGRKRKKRTEEKNRKEKSRGGKRKKRVPLDKRRSVKARQPERRRRKPTKKKGRKKRNEPEKNNAIIREAIPPSPPGKKQYRLLARLTKAFHRLADTFDYLTTTASSIVIFGFRTAACVL